MKKSQKAPGVREAWRLLQAAQRLLRQRRADFNAAMRRRYGRAS
jgi:hypothetical protein